VVFFHGCTIFRLPQVRDGETAAQCFKRISETNDLLISCKGIAKVSTNGFAFNINERVAFISRKPDQLRAEMLTPFGVIGSPFQLISNNKKIFFNSRFLEKPYYINPGALSLQYMSPINIQPFELIAVLHGQLPVEPNMRAAFDPCSEQKVLLLSKGIIKKTRLKVMFDYSATHVRSFEKYNYFNKLMYRMTFNKYQTNNNFYTPQSLTITNAKEQRITLDIQSYYPNCAIKKHPFQIPEPQHDEKGGFSCITSWLFMPVQILSNMF
jgi:outer membrane lipoprotein-sorting protein